MLSQKIKDGDGYLRRVRHEKKKKSNTGKIVLIFILLMMVILGSYLGYSIQKNGGGLQGVLATVLGQDAEKLEDVDTINVLVLRSK